MADRIQKLEEQYKEIQIILDKLEPKKDLLSFFKSFLSKEKEGSFIPKILHFIWVGPNQLKDKYVSNIVIWIKNNPEFLVILWVDQESNYYDHLKNNVEQIHSFLSQEEKGRFYPVDIQCLGYDCYDNTSLYEFIRYEIDKLRPNFGIASDLLRYNILYQIGGMYCDVDVQPKKDVDLSTIFYGVFNVKESGNKLFIPILEEKISVANDILICNINDKRMIFCIKQAVNYYKESESIHNPKFVYHCSRPKVIKEITMACTGTQSSSFSKVFWLGTYLKRGSITENLKIDSAGTWLNRPVCKINDIDTAKKRVIQSIKFEAKIFKMLRLEDHVGEFCCSFRDKYDQSLVNLILKEVRKMIQYENFLRNVIWVQKTFLYQEIDAFYDEYKLNCIWKNFTVKQDIKKFEELLAPKESCEEDIVQPNINIIDLTNEIMRKEYYCVARLNFLKGLKQYIQNFPNTERLCGQIKILIEQTKKNNSGIIVEEKSKKELIKLVQEQPYQPSIAQNTPAVVLRHDLHPPALFPIASPLEREQSRKKCKCCVVF